MLLSYRRTSRKDQNTLKLAHPQQSYISHAHTLFSKQETLSWLPGQRQRESPSTIQLPTTICFVSCPVCRGGPLP